MNRATNINVVDGYLRLLDNLAINNKLDLIARLTLSMKTDTKAKESAFKKSFGAFQSEQTAEELIDEIRSSRVFNRQIETF
jgi:hypothetical protein